VLRVGLADTDSRELVVRGWARMAATADGAAAVDECVRACGSAARDDALLTTAVRVCAPTIVLKVKV